MGWEPVRALQATQRYERLRFNELVMHLNEYPTIVPYINHTFKKRSNLATTKQIEKTKCKSFLT